ncbi:hypothetical protein GCK72_009662 [Caenorhabditis remanei]|uniref:Uncharacterized protein n=1 Tax=Caenorhabditis remanei TaxID=31234 RepID=A0A6A5H3I7_CAERE|nr:hypothetical protein GCK72_009662 [Caenorhabditis remanei]KAF1761406.1 hypothetical protein GCK72_009662 [Caenorhabditis remanei]
MAEVAPAGTKSPALSVPVVIWGPKPPENKICTIRVLPDGSTIITGAENGHIVIWKLSEGLMPKQLMIGHSQKITAISQTNNAPTNTRFVSASADGRVCLWEIQDGRCIDSTTSVAIHRYIYPYTYKSSRHTRATRLLCIGDYSDIQVMDPQDLTVVFCIASRVEPDWISCFIVINHPGKEDQLIGMTLSGMMKVWTLNELEKKDPSCSLYEDESKRLEIQHIRSVSYICSTRRMLLIVASSNWMIIDMDDLSTVVLYKNKNTSKRCTAGYLTDMDKVTIGYTDESINVFQLPITSLQKEDGSSIVTNNRPTTNYFDEPDPFIVASVNGVQDNIKSCLNDVQYAFLPYDLSTEPSSSGAAEKKRFSVVRSSKRDGSVLVWNMPPFDHQFMKAVPALRNLPFKFNGTYRESLASIWQTINESEDGSMPVLNSEAVCCSLFVTSQGKLFLGRSDGIIVMTYACETLARQWLRVPAERATSRTLNGHDAAVRTMFYPFEHDTKYDPQYFVSGSDDFSVIVWNINSGVKIHRFIVHGGPVKSFMIPPPNCSKQVTKCIASIASDNSVALLNIRDSKCMLLASRHPFPIVQVKWRPLDDFMLVKLSDGSVYVWQMETANLDRIATGLLAEDIMAACDEQIGIEEGTDETSAHHAVQLIRALKNKNMEAVKQKVVGTASGSTTPSTHNDLLSNCGTAVQLGSPMAIIPLPGCAQGAHLVQFEISALISGILHLDSSVEAPEGKTTSQKLDAAAAINETNTVTGLSRKLTWQFEANLYLDVARLMLSMLHAWSLDEDMDEVCEKRLSLHRPRHQVYFGNVSRQGELSVCLPTRFATDFESFCKKSRWQASHSLNTSHLLAVIATSNTLMAMKNSALQLAKIRKSIVEMNPAQQNPDRQQIKQGWSLVAALHCVLLPDHVRPRSSYAPPSIEMLVRRWQDSCLEIREAAQALLIRELTRLGTEGRRRLIESWTPFLPPLLDDSLSIFGSKLQSSVPTVQPSAPAPPIPPRTKNEPVDVTPVRGSEPPTAEGGEAGIQQVRRNQATSIILLGVIGSEFGDELNRADLTRATAVSLLELLVAAPSNLIPVHSPLRRAAIDLLGRGFVHWEPHLEISKVVLGLLDLASNNDKQGTLKRITGAPLNAIEDAARTSRQALSLIALARPPALITSLSMEVARYNAAAQHQTIQHTVVSPLLKSRSEVLRIVEELCEKRYNDIIAMLLPVGDILVHCLDITILKHKSMADVFPPIVKFNMVAYCSSSKRIAFGGKNGTCVVHELRASKTHSLPSHNGPIAAVAFSEDGKFLATYGAEDGKINFFQTSQSFLGMGQAQLKLTKSQPAPTVSVPTTPSGTSFRPRLVWINSKSLTLMLPEGREQRFSL